MELHYGVKVRYTQTQSQTQGERDAGLREARGAVEGVLEGLMRKEKEKEKKGRGRGEMG